MADPLGQLLLDQHLLSEKQLQEALARQRLLGGRLGPHLVALGYLTATEVATFFRIFPRAPASVEETGLELTFIADLVLKHLLHLGEFRLAEVADRVRLPLAVVDAALDLLRREKLIEVKGASELLRSTYQFSISETGKLRAGQLLEICRYVGPAPVTLAAYRRFAELQDVRQLAVGEESLRQALAQLLLPEKLLLRLGPAVNSGKPIFFYGPSGNGKTSIAEALGGLLADPVYLPHAVIVDGQLIQVFDPVSHHPAEGDEELQGQTDRRWLRVRRPIVRTGGELTLRAFELEFNPVAKFYQAPLQLKANNGVLIIDDFGRQKLNPEAFLNRWIVNLDRREDFLSLHTGMTFAVPFNQLVIISTNLDPGGLFDEAFFRRLPYKIRIDRPSADSFEAIFRQVCAANGLAFDPEAFAYLRDRCYRERRVDLCACHPRDLIDQILEEARFRQRPPQLTPEAIEAAWQNYFGDE